MSWINNSAAVYADLHMHSTASDGVLEPHVLASQLNRLNVKAAALTDHDSIDGIEEFRNSFKGRCITGVELSVVVNDMDVHLLGYNFDTGHSEMAAALRMYRETRSDRILKICEKLKDLGISLDGQAILSGGNGSTSFGRPHIARLMVEQGAVRSVQEAFDKFLGNNGPAYVPKHKMSFQEGVDLIHRAGGLAVLAHPGLYFRDDLMSAILAEPIDGVELYHPQHNSEIRENILRTFNGHVRFRTGGSDFHGSWDGRDNLAMYGLDFDEWLIMKKALE